MDAEACFAKSGAASWKDGQMPPGAQDVRLPNGGQVNWIFFNEDVSAFVKFNCIRAVSGGQFGIPRLNIQEVTVDEQATGNGFCVTGEIGGKTGTVEDTNMIHAKCTTSTPTSLNACKSLVSQALTNQDLAFCAQSYCSTSVLDVNKCLKMIGSGSSDDGWLNTYCAAVGISNGVSTSTCKKNVNAQGYEWAVDAYGLGKKVTEIGQRECGTTLAQYAYENKPTCEDGVALEIKLPDGTWKPMYFFPVSQPPCNGALVVTGTEPGANPLFSHPLRMTQCDVKGDPVCQNISPCTNTYGISFSLEFTNLQRQLTELYNNGALLCVPRAGDNPPSYTWCLPNSPDYKPSPEMCPCPDSGNGRLLLTGRA